MRSGRRAGRTDLNSAGCPVRKVEIKYSHNCKHPLIVCAQIKTSRYAANRAVFCYLRAS